MTGKTKLPDKAALALLFSPLIFGCAPYQYPPPPPEVSAPDKFLAEIAGLELSFPLNLQEVRGQSDGTRVFEAHGTIKNIGSELREIPDLLVVLVDKREREVFRQKIHPAQNGLRPGEVLPIDFTLAGIPETASYADIGWSP